MPIISPISRFRSVRSDDQPLFTLGEVSVLELDEIEGMVELTAGCSAPVGAEELRVPIELPIRERWLVVGSLFAFEGDGVLRLLELPMREAPLERAAGCSTLLGTDGLVVSIVLRKESIGLPIRDDILGLIRLLEFVLSEVEVLSTGRLSVLRVIVAGLFVVVVCEGLLDGVLVLIELPIRDDILGLIRLLVLGAVGVGRELIDRLDMLVLGARLVMALLEILLLGARLVIALLELLVLGVRLVIALLEMLVLGARLVIALLELLLLGVRLVIARLDETLLELLEGVGLEVALGAGAGLEACRVC